MKATRFMYAMGLVMLASCGNNEKDYDATGTFEATEVTVSAEQSGTLLKFTITEGDRIEQGAEVGLIDTTQLASITSPIAYINLVAFIFV